MPAHIQIDQRAQQPLQRAGDPREQSEQQGQIVIVVITENGKERQLEGHLVIGDSLRLITAHQPIPVGTNEISAVLLTGAHLIDQISGVQHETGTVALLHQ